MAVRDDLSDINEGRYSNVLIFLAAGILLYILVRGWNQAKQDVLSDNIGSNLNGQLAQRLRQAFIPLGFPTGMGFDGTDVPAVMAVAAQIKDYQAVASAYRTLYNGDLSNDLSEELSVGDLATFWRTVNAGATTGTTATPGTTTGVSSSGNTTGTTATVIKGTEVVVSSLVGKTCVANTTVNVRLYDDPRYADSQAVKGDTLGTYVGEADLTINGSKGRFVHLKKAAVWGLYYVDFWVFKSSLTFI